MRPPDILLAPMAGFTDAVTRRIAISYGAPMCTTEMVSAKGLMYKSKQSEELLHRLEGEDRYIVQIFGSDPGEMGEAAEIVQEKAADALFAIDINMGCPAPKIFRHGDGSALLADPRLASEIVREVKRRAKVPVSVKMRIGIRTGEDNAVQFARAMQDAGADWITVHGRTRDQYYSGQADWDKIEETAKAVDVPIIGNGDIRTAKEVLERLENSACSGVMIGRAAIGNPFLFSQIHDYIIGRKPKTPTAQERIEVLTEHLRMAIQDKGEKRGVLEMRAQMPRYLRGMHGACEMRVRLNCLTSPEDIEAELAGYSERIAGLEDPQWEIHSDYCEDVGCSDE